MKKLLLLSALFLLAAPAFAQSDHIVRCVRAGSATVGSATCICRDATNDNLFIDRDCDATQDTSESSIEHETHATDCTALSCSGTGSFCYEQDANTVYVCEAGTYTTINIAGILDMVHVTDGADMIRGRVGTDTQYRIVIRNNGQFRLGPGGVTAQDVQFQRGGTDLLVFEDQLRIDNDFGITFGDGTGSSDVTLFDIDTLGTDGSAFWDSGTSSWGFVGQSVIFRSATPGFVFDETTDTGSGTSDGSLTLSDCASSADCGPVKISVREDSVLQPVVDFNSTTNASDSTFVDGSIVLRGNTAATSVPRATVTWNLAYTGTVGVWRLNISGVVTSGSLDGYEWDAPLIVKGVFIDTGTSTPSGSCTTGTDGLYVDRNATSAGGLYVCENGTWSAKK
jgi:hypothetical protein